MEPSAISLDVFELVRTAQNQNGLRHSDFARYRAYCTRKLRRLREGRLVRVLHGTGKKWRPLAQLLTAGVVKGPRHLQLLLFQAERAWAFAMELKGLVEKSEGVTSRARRVSRSVQRMRRALYWAECLKALCATTADARTQLEVDAYSACMRGALCLERRQWGDTLTAYATATQVYEELARVSVRRVKDMYLAKLEDIAPIVRLAKYNLGRGGKKGGAAAAAASAALTAPQGDLATKFQAAAAQSEGATADGVGSVCWRGAILPVRSDKLRGILGAVGEAVAVDSGGGGGAKLTLVEEQRAEALYIDVLTRLDEGVRLGEAEALRAGKEGKEVLEQDLVALASYIRFTKLRTTLERLVRHGKAAMAGFEEVESGSKVAGANSATATAAPAAVAAATPAGAWGASPLHTAMDGLLSGVSGGGSKGASSLSARNTAIVFSKAMGVVDELLAMLVTLPPSSSPSASASAASSGGGGGGGPTHTTVLKEDEHLRSALMARRAWLAAHKSWYIALTCLHLSRYSEALGMMSRAEVRVESALGGYRALVETLGLGKEGGLPASPRPPGLSGEVSLGASATVHLSGVGESEVGALHELLKAISLRRVSIQAGGVLEALAPKARADAPLLSLYATLRATSGDTSRLPPTLVKSPRRGYLIEKGACGGVIWPGGGSLEPSKDASAVTPSAAVPVLGALPVPFKPILFDLAFSGVDYPMAALAALGGVKETTAAPSPTGGKLGAPSPAPSQQKSEGDAAAAAAGASSPGSGVFGWIYRTG